MGKTFSNFSLASGQVAATQCRHCGSRFEPTRAEEEFCCHGCRTVFAILQDEGLSSFYHLRDQSPPLCPVPAQISTESFSYCDDPEIVRRFTRHENQIEFFIEGLNCSACLWLLERLPEICPDIQHAEVCFAKSTVIISKKPEGSFAKAAQALNRIGYRPHLIDDSEHVNRLRTKERRKDLIRIAIAAVCTGNIMIFAVSLYGGASGTLGAQFQWLTALLAAPVLTFSAWPFYKSAWNAIRGRDLNLDVPIVAALVAGILMSVWSLARGSSALYFDSLSMLVLLLLSSRTWLKALQQKHLDASHLEDSLLVGTADRLLSNGETEPVSSLSLQEGDRVLIRHDQLIPADGRVDSGEGVLNAAVMTGESAPQKTHLGDKVFAGTRCLSGKWILKVEKPATQSRLAEILREAEVSSRTKPAMARFADRVGRAFVGLVMLTALVVVAYFFSIGQTAEGFSRALALVIVTCPCVFGMAIPLSLSLAVKAAASRGLIIKDGDALERLADIRTLIFDKTGTLTTGQMTLSNLETLDNGLHSLPALFALEKDQDHPVGSAVRAALQLYSRADWTAENVKPLASGGIEGSIRGETYSVIPQNISQSEQLNPNPDAVRSRFALMHRNQIIARFDIGDEVREDAKTAVSALKENGFEIRVLSGDRAAVVERVGHILDLEPQALESEVSPEEKSARVRNRAQTSMMIGDGANDAAALAAAGVGVAVRGSMDVSLRAADIYLVRHDLTALEDLFQISRATRVAIFRNLIFSASFNLIAGYLAISGMMEPLLAAIMMPLSSLTVLASSLATGRQLSSAPREIQDAGAHR